MKVLYVDANVWHLNPTANLQALLFRERFCGTCCYGPGFSSRDELERGLRRFIEARGPFDVLVLGPNTPFLVDGADAIEGAVGYLMKYTAHRLSGNALVQFFADVRQSFGHLEVPVKLVSVLNFDYYATTQTQIDHLLEQDVGVLGPNEQFSLRLEDLPSFATREKHYVHKVERLSNAWYDFLVRHPERVVTAVHFVAATEFIFEPLDARPFDVAVPGVEYQLRKEAVKRLSGTRWRSASKAYFHFYRLANRLGLPVFSHPVALRLYNQFFQRTLADTRCVYTARGGFGMPIRKFFEIPAAGALVLCSPCNGYADLGFEDGRHYIAVEPDGLVDALAKWLVDPRSQEIASAGQAVTMTNHSLAARGEQIERCLRAMVAGTYAGSRWDRGEFRVLEKA